MANITVLKGSAIRKEHAAAAALQPGQLALLGTTGTLTAQGAGVTTAVRKAFVEVEDMVGGAIDSTYAIGDTVQVAVCLPGAEVQALVAAAADAIVVGDLIETGALGTVRKRAAGVPIAIALEAVDNSGGSDNVFIKIEIL